MLGILGRLLPWALIVWFWYLCNSALDKIDAEKAKNMASPFWSKLFPFWGWTLGARTKFTVFRYVVSGVFMFFIIRWLAAMISTPVP